MLNIWLLTLDPMYGKCIISIGQWTPLMTSLITEASVGISDVIYGLISLSIALVATSIITLAQVQICPDWVLSSSKPSYTSNLYKPEELQSIRVLAQSHKMKQNHANLTYWNDENFVYKKLKVFPTKYPRSFKHWRNMERMLLTNWSS